MLYESHMHTPLCKHARGEPEAYTAAAETRGLSGIIITCHNPLPDGMSANVRMAPEQFPEYLALVDRARQAWADRIDVRLGLECDYIPGLEDFLRRQTASAPFDYILGSVHPHLGYYQERYDKAHPIAFQRQYFENLARASETGLFDSLAHPDLVKNITADHWQVDRLMDDIRRALDRIAAAGTAMELNTSGLNKTVHEMNPGPSILKEMARRGIPVTLGSDAHDPHRVAGNWEEALAQLEQAGYTQISLFLERRRRNIPLADAKAALRPATP